MLTTVQEHTTQSKTQAKTKAFVAPAPVIQKKLKIGAVDDPLEAEADAMADKVVQQMDTPPVPPSNKGSLVQKKCSQCKDDELQKKPLADGISSWVQKKSLLSGRQSVASEGITNQINASQGGGSLMGDTTRSFMESSFGNDFSGVKIHTDSNAIQLSKALNAQAFTVGNDIYFNEGKYNPSTTSGKHLLAHELTHTIQQGGIKRKTIQRQIETGGRTVTPLNQMRSDTMGSGSLSSIESVANNLLSRNEVIADSRVQELLRLRNNFNDPNGTITYTESQYQEIQRLYSRTRSLLPAWVDLPLIDFDQYLDSEPEMEIQRVAMVGGAMALGGGAAATATAPAWLPALLIVAIIICIAIIIILLLDGGNVTPDQVDEADDLVDEALDRQPRPIPMPEEIGPENIPDEHIDELPETEPSPRPGPQQTEDPPPPPPPQRRRICYLHSLMLESTGRNTWTNVGRTFTPQDLRIHACVKRRLVGTSNRAFQRKNIAVGRFRVGTVYHLIATENPERNYHSEDELLRLAEAQFGANGFLWDALFTERRPCPRCAGIIGRYRTTPDFRVYALINNDYDWLSIKEYYNNGVLF